MTSKPQYNFVSTVLAVENKRHKQRTREKADATPRQVFDDRNARIVDVARPESRKSDAHLKDGSREGENPKVSTELPSTAEVKHSTDPKGDTVGECQNKRHSLSAESERISIPSANPADEKKSVQETKFSDADYKRHFPLHVAIYACDQASIDRILDTLDAKRYADEQDDEGVTPSMLAAAVGDGAYGHLIIKLIKERGDVNKADSQGMTALMYAAKGRRASHVHILEVLLVYADIDLQDKNGKTALMHIIEAFPDDAGEEDLRQQTRTVLGTYIDCLNQREVGSEGCMDLQDKDGRTPLHLAAIKGDYILALLVLSWRKKRPNLGEQEGERPEEQEWEYSWGEEVESSRSEELDYLGQEDWECIKGQDWDESYQLCCLLEEFEISHQQNTASSDTNNQLCYIDPQLRDKDGMTALDYAEQGRISASAEASESGEVE